MDLALEMLDDIQAKCFSYIEDVELHKNDATYVDLHYIKGVIDVCNDIIKYCDGLGSMVKQEYGYERYR